jgi:hypothetical protein
MVDMVELVFASLEKLAHVNRATFLFLSRSPPVRALKHHPRQPIRVSSCMRTTEQPGHFYTYLVIEKILAL